MTLHIVVGMEILTKRQKEILAYLNKKYPFRERRIHLIIKFIEGTDEPRDVENIRAVIADITLLEEMQLVEKKYGQDGEARLKITSKGKEKLRENFKTQLMDTAYKNPWAVIAILITLILGLIALWK